MLEDCLELIYLHNVDPLCFLHATVYNFTIIKISYLDISLSYTVMTATTRYWVAVLDL